MGAKPKSQTVGFRYYFDIHFALGKKVDEICEIRASGKTAWKGSITNNGQIRINAPKLFGGDKGEGGLDGTLDVMFGDEGQTVVAKLASMLGGIVPAFRGITSGFYSGMISAINPYPKTWEILRRGGNRLWGSDGAWYPDKQFIWLADNQIKAMNPAHILYLVYTGQEFRGLPRARMDEAAWRKAADTLYTEQLGLCFEWKRSDSYKSFCETVKAHIGAEIFPDRMSGLLSIRLIRDDYDATTLPLFDEDSGLLEITQEQATSSASAPSQLVVKFVDQVRGDPRQVVIANNAVAAATGRRSTESVEYFGAPTAQIAGRLGARDMRIKASGLKRFKIVLDRRGRWLTPGAVFRIRSARRGMAETVVRAGRIEDNFLGDGKVTVTVLQDQFGLPSTSSVAVPPSGWVPPDRAPRAVTTRRLFEAPYRELAAIIDPANFKLLDPTAAYLIAVAEAPTSLSQSFNLTDRVGTSGSFVDRGAGDWCPSGLLVSDLPAAATAGGVTLSGSTRLDEVRVGQAALIDEEIVRVDAVDYTNARLTLARGCADTVPAVHPAGARIWFYDGFECVDETVYTQGVSLQAQLLSNTSEGQLAPGMAATDTLALVGRQGRPYPPGQFKVNGAYYPGAVEGVFSVSWAHRDRLQQADQLLDSSIGNIGPESGTSYVLRLRRADTNAVLVQQTGLTATSSNPVSSEFAGDIIIELLASRGGIESTQAHRHRISYTPPKPTTALLLHMDGVQDSATFLDEAGNRMLAVGSARQDTASGRFGGGALLDGTASWIETAGSQAFVFGLGDFTVELWLKTSSTKGQCLLDFFTPGQSGWQLWINGSGRLEWYRNTVVATATSSMGNGVWRHVAVSRAAGTLRIFVDGVQEASASDSASYSTQTTKLALGAQVTSRNASYDFSGVMDEVRIIKGRAVYTSNFAPPQAPFTSEI